MRWARFCLLLLAGGWTSVLAAAQAKTNADAGWDTYGGTASGQRYSSAKQIDRSNVKKLVPAWVFHTHALEGPPSKLNERASFEATPIFWNDTLYVDSPFNQVFAVDAATGAQKWAFDPQVDRNQPVFNVVSRGVVLWHAAKPGTGLCGAHVVYTATIDRRLIALDAATGKPCPRFGARGVVDLMQGIEVADKDLFETTSPPTVVGNTVIVGSQVGDNQAVFSASGAVRGYDAETGAQKWMWEPIPWAMAEHPHRAGSANAWAPMSGDAEHDLVFIPTGAPSVDFYGGMRPGDNRDANSIVALQASTGKRVWAYQLVHHDLWDYDVPSQPLLFDFRGSIPAVAVVTKQNMVFVFNRLTGEPLYPIFEKPVPQSDLPGEMTSPTQPFSSLPPLMPLTMSADDVKLSHPDTAAYCKAALGRLVNNGLFTPPSLHGSLVYPGSLGGANWGSAAFDPRSGTLYVRVSSVPFSVREVRSSLKDRPLTARISAKLHNMLPQWLGGDAPPEAATEFRTPDSLPGEHETSPQRGTPYLLMRRAILAPDGTPCAPQPFGSVVALNLNSGAKLWSVPHGSLNDWTRGSHGVGGVIVTAGGLVFAASTNDALLRAYDAVSGAELWQAPLPAVAEATPMTYTVHGRQFVVIAAGGHGSLGGRKLNDTVVAFALPPARGVNTQRPGRDGQTNTGHAHAR
jgi:quinoprotein glucose dehydrogenase